MPARLVDLNADIRAAFERYIAHSDPEAFLIIEDARGRFVQFTREEGRLLLDLPTQALSPHELLQAEQVVVRELGGWREDIDAKHFCYKIACPPDPQRLTDTTVDVFLRILGGAPERPLTVIVDV